MIVHLTTAHPRDDSRIRYKELASLKKAYGGEVALFVQDGRGDEYDHRLGLQIYDTGRLAGGRLQRLTVGGWRMFNAARHARPQVAHFHDPELLPWAIPLALWGIKVVYDVHDDVPRQLMHGGLPRWARLLASPIAAFAEWAGTHLMAGIVAATPEIAARFPRQKTVIIHNYAIFDEMSLPTYEPMADRSCDFAYVGTINRNRNIFGMIEAIDLVPNPSSRLRVAGEFVLATDRAYAETMPGWERVDCAGWLSRKEVACLLGRVRAGLLLLKPIPHFVESLPIKLFEYMAAGIPIIASDYPMWREIIDWSGCGILVDPENRVEIATAMQWILDHPQEAEAMGLRGRRAALERYNWDTEGERLVNFYADRLGVQSRSGAPPVELGLTGKA